MKKQTSQAVIDGRKSKSLPQVRNGAKAPSAWGEETRTVSVSLPVSLVGRIKEVMKRDDCSATIVVGTALTFLFDHEREENPAVPLPPLRGIHKFYTPTAEETSSLPCGVEALRMQLVDWYYPDKWSDEVLQHFYEVYAWYESLRHHPYFRRHARALRDMAEGDRRLGALLSDQVIFKRDSAAAEGQGKAVQP